METSVGFHMNWKKVKDSKYPYEPPLVFLKSNACLPPLMELHICKKLYEEAVVLAEDGIPCVYSVTELLRNEEAMREYLKTEMDFLDPRQKLFATEKIIEHKTNRPTHYKKGVTNKNNKKSLSYDGLIKEDEKIVKDFNLKLTNPRYKKMLSVRKNLPAWALKNDILNSIKSQQVVVISGETGCGKSTQVPQFIFDDWITNYQNEHVEIVCTQPRRISAIGVAERVADERAEKIGATVGYQIRLESKISSSTRLTFCTTGILLRRLESDPVLSNVTHVIVDEVHERSEESDFLLLILKELLPLRPDLKIILMSATLNASLFSSYFGGIPVIDIPGRTFPVEQYFLEDILEETGYVLEHGSEYCRKIKSDSQYIEMIMATQDVGVPKPRDNIKDENLSIQQFVARYEGFSLRTCKNMFFMDPDKINNDLIESVLLWVVEGDHNYPREGTILVFLPGIAEITSLFDQLVVHEEFGRRRGKYLILPLHSSLTSEEQSAIFRKTDGQRKIVLSTNLAETSVTIDDCVFVIDGGKMKEKHFDTNRNMESLETVWVTQANALQRKGRAGRVMSGVCVHLYTRHRFKHHFLHQPIPEILRVPLEQLILNIKILPAFEDRGVVKVLSSFIESPEEESITTALKRLHSVGAMDKEENLTALGHHLAALPVDVRIGKLMLYGTIFGCVDSALTMAACLSYQSPFVSPFEKRIMANKKKLTFSAGHSDQITCLMAYNKFLTVKKKSLAGARNFANENYLSFKTLCTIADIKYQFLELLVNIGFIPADLSGVRRRMGEDIVEEITTSIGFNVNGENLRLLSSILCAALYPNIVKVLTPPKTYMQSSAGAVIKEHDPKDLKFATPKEMVFLHPSSVNYKVTNYPSPYLVYQEKVRTSKVFFRDCTMVPIIPLVLFCGDLEIAVQNGSSFLCLENGWIVFQVEDHKVAELVKLIRIELCNLLEEKIKDPLLNLLHNDHGERVIGTILNLISA
ncbi:putative ATP-dependent RNA helicase DHX57 isoform X2 [Rhynchophorus ferrugineus]|uniref:putative ATP-dependent RNA helicase DHX57 isoform X2 n=1 Tax=Rhynchophorus ferrugineus TaxID=354439 RepID=UPI003FCD6798